MQSRFLSSLEGVLVPSTSSNVTAITTVTLLTMLAACSDSTSPSMTRAARMSEAVASAFPLAHATVHVLAGLDGMTPTAINDSDEVVGYTGGPVANSANFRPFRWTAAKGVTMLQLGNNAWAQANAVNDHGVIAGTGSVEYLAANRAVAWLPDGSVRDLPLWPDSLDTEVAPNGCAISGMNIYGAIVGTCIAHGAFQIATQFFWHSPATGAGNAEYTSISDDGWIGGAEDEEYQIGTPFIISPSKQGITLKGHDGLAHNGSAVNAITHHGWAAGYSGESGCRQAVAWLDHAGQTYPEFRMGVCGQSTGITDDWYVTGTASDSALDASTDWAFVWFPGPGTQRLPGLGGTGETSTAVAISNTTHHVLGTITSGGARHVVIWDVGPRS
ncbi:MAG TPA: hypothetical protein VFA43_25205 [Gemmatimonadaceae bacterium]|nr:hypothetical protein [Gemmatimonadaceae bacterium]